MIELKFTIDESDESQIEKAIALLQSFSDTKPEVKTAKSKKTTAVKQEAQVVKTAVKEEAHAVSKDDLRAMVANNPNLDKVKVREKLGSLGANNISELAEEHHEELFNFIKSLV